MRPRRFFSFYRCVCFLSVFCVFAPPLVAVLREPVFPGADCLLASLLSSCAVLLMLPVGEEDARTSFRYALGVPPACVGGLLAGWPARVWLLPALLLQGACLFGRSRDLYVQMRPLFRHTAVWYNVENHARYAYCLALYLLASAVPAPGAPAWAAKALLVPASALLVLLILRVRTGRTWFVRKDQELEIKKLVRFNLRTPPPQAGADKEELAKMTRLYERTTALMEKNHLFLDEEFNMDDLAAAVFTNRSYLSRTINIISGRNFRQFINYFRVKYSQDLMRQDPLLKLSKVAMMAGFRSKGTFNAAYKLNTGETPSAFQERLRSGRNMENRHL